MFQNIIERFKNILKKIKEILDLIFNINKDIDKLIPKLENANNELEDLINNPPAKFDPSKRQVIEILDSEAKSAIDMICGNNQSEYNNCAINIRVTTLSDVTFGTIRLYLPNHEFVNYEVRVNIISEDGGYSFSMQPPSLYSNIELLESYDRYGYPPSFNVDGFIERDSISFLQVSKVSDVTLKYHGLIHNRKAPKFNSLSVSIIGTKIEKPPHVDRGTSMKMTLYGGEIQQIITDASYS